VHTIELRDDFRPGARAHWRLSDRYVVMRKARTWQLNIPKGDDCGRESQSSEIERAGRRRLSGNSGRTTADIADAVKKPAVEKPCDEILGRLDVPCTVAATAPLFPRSVFDGDHFWRTEPS